MKRYRNPKSQLKARKPRIPSIGLDFGRPETIAGMQKNDDGSVTLLGVDGMPLYADAGFTSVVYQRPGKRPKVTVQIPDSGPTLGSVPRALARYPEIIGVDTNWCTYGGEKVCAAVVCKLTTVRYEGPRWFCEADPLWGLEFREPSKDAERIGWALAITAARERGHVGPNFLLVVDAHLDSLHKINQRSEPVIDDLFLPPGASMAYASSDTTDSPLNGLMGRCDRVATEMLRVAIGTQTASSSLGPLLQGERTPFKQHRYWTFK